MAETPARGRWWMGLAAMGLAFLLLFVVLEVGFRLAEAALAEEVAPGESWAAYDEDLAYRNRPGWGDHNAHGLRDHPVDDPKRRFRVLVVGDSVPYYGDDVDDTWPGRLETLLNADPAAPAAEVLNAGTRGYTNYQQTLWLEKYGLALEPDLVLVSFVLNDLHHILHRFEVVDGEIVGQEYSFSQEAVESVDSGLYRLLRKSHLLVWLRRRLAIFDDLVALYTQDGFSFDYRPDFSTAWQDAPWEDVEAQLGRVVALGEERGFEVAVVVFPFGDQLREDYLARDRDYVLKPQRKLGEVCTRLGIEMVDLFDTLSLERDMDPDLVHLSPQGRGVAAAAVARELRARGLDTEPGRAE